ncbi:proton-conducting transporter transmembrane domain-containing protein [Galbibacter mesophilus]|uniref:proton-conducting transporter transmembrane domain-containing protein n=1 Tax=Galbibacter mesophilus TaxID=379069 RepID=UPI00191CB580|nr:proton-conducting transporter membrane subunit [Galbibacter mesophilus]MCM5662397.1 pesticidal protein Cry28Aa [Galbibacter mesophilus]
MKNINKRDSFNIFKILNPLLWLLFIANALFLLLSFPNIQEWRFDEIFRINGFTMVIWTVVSFFSAIISTYSSNYLKGYKYYNRFGVFLLGFTVSVFVLVISNHLLPFLLSWAFMGLFMAQLIGIDKRWGEAREAFKFTLKYFMLGTLFLAIGTLLLAFYTNEYTITGILAGIDGLSKVVLITSTMFIILAAIIQSAMYPFHRWLLSAMTAPTPASALMHAGFVNAAGILLTLFAPLLFAASMLDLLFIIGGVTAITAQFAKLLQVSVKQKLACSTMAQMGFMIMQCGLGFFNAAVAHLILHGFYKAYLFLSVGDTVEQKSPEDGPIIKITPLQSFLVLIFGVLGAALFALLTGKGTSLDSGIILTLVVAITVGQVTYNIVKQKSLSPTQRIALPAFLSICGIALYAIVYNGVSLLLIDMPLANAGTSLSVLQISTGVLFLLGFFIMKLGVYRRVPFLYVKLLNDSQPFNKTVLSYKSKL